MRTVISAVFIALFTLLAGQAFIGVSPAYAQGAATASTAAPTSTSSTNESYRLGPGDKIHLSVFGEPDLSSDFTVDGTGMAQLPLIGQIKAAGLTGHRWEAAITKAFVDGQYRSAGQRRGHQLSDLLHHREVNKPGEYPYVNDMNALNAVALAGGYTFRADQSDVYIRRNGSPSEKSYPADQTTKVQPGDIIRVGERFF